MDLKHLLILRLHYGWVFLSLGYGLHKETFMFWKGSLSSLEEAHFELARRFFLRFPVVNLNSNGIL